MKIGLLGGSFNPIHLGHLKIAETVLSETEINEIWFVPSGNHPLKASNQFKPVESRIRLIEKVISSNPAFRLSRLDSDQETPSYTAQLIRKLKLLYPQHEFYFIAGADIVGELPLWFEYKWLIDNIKFIILNRPSIDKSRWQDLDYLDKLIFIKMEPIEIASTEIRRLVGEGKEIAGLVPDYLEEDVKALYQKLKI